MQTEGKGKLPVVGRLFEKEETLRYIFWGFAAVGVSYFSFVFLDKIMPYQIANLISILCTKAFAYFTNRKFVFRSETEAAGQFKEIVRFIMSRGFTGVVDFFGLILLTEVFLLESKVGKMIMIPITTAMNYLLGKFFVFRGRPGKESEKE